MQLSKKYANSLFVKRGLFSDIQKATQKLCWLVGEAESGVATIKDDELSLKQDVSVNGESNAIIRLNPTVALRAGNRSVVYI
jgi:hypothetical protein